MLFMAKVAPICPWGFLDPSRSSSSSSLSPSNSSLTPQKKTFAQALNDAFDIHLSQLPRPCLNGDKISIKISEDAYQAGLARCKYSLHGRLLLQKGESPIRVNDLKAKLAKLWHPINQWSMVSLGKGFYEFSFASAEDQCSVWSVGSWSLKPGFLRLSAWTPDFNPNSIKQTEYQCWIRIIGLPQEYWSPKILFEMAGCFGTPIALDETTIKRIFGHYGRVLVDLDLNSKLRDEILVEREGYAFSVFIEYEKLPEFCTNCQTIGHSLGNYKKLVSKAMNLVKDQVVQKDKANHKLVSIYVPKKKDIINLTDKDPVMHEVINAEGVDNVQVNVNNNVPEKPSMECAVGVKKTNDLQVATDKGKSPIEDPAINDIINVASSSSSNRDQRKKIINPIYNDARFNNFVRVGN